MNYNDASKKLKKYGIGYPTLGLELVVIVFALKKIGSMVGTDLKS